MISTYPDSMRWKLKALFEVACSHANDETVAELSFVVRFKSGKNGSFCGAKYR
jgi:hypothetical protein